jgi:hypothetical protein
MEDIVDRIAATEKVMLHQHGSLLLAVCRIEATVAKLPEPTSMGIPLGRMTVAMRELAANFGDLIVLTEELGEVLRDSDSAEVRSRANQLMAHGPAKSS